MRQRELLVNALRMRPDRIIVGEVRGEEALDMLQAMNTGHDGSITTVDRNTLLQARFTGRLSILATASRSVWMVMGEVEGVSPDGFITMSIMPPQNSEREYKQRVVFFR